MLIHDSHKAFYREPAGPVIPETRVTFRLRCDDAATVILRTWMDEELCYTMMCGADHVWEVAIDMPDHPGLFWYYFLIYREDGRTVRYGNAFDLLGGEGAVWDKGDPESFQITIYDKEYKTPDFFHGVNIYQIFPDRFFKAPTAAVDKRTDRFVYKNWDDELKLEYGVVDGNYAAMDFYGGTLTGVQKKLGYLKELGVDIIYLNPIFQSRSNHRYDTGDYTKVDPMLGTNEEFVALCKAAKKLGMRVMLDGVFSHTGEDSIYFNRYGHYDSEGAYQSAHSPYYDWYTFRSFPEDYRSWWNFRSLPEIRKDNPEYQDFMFRDKVGIVPRWIEAGACGWRLDVADELPMAFLRRLRKAAKKADPNAVVLGEVWEDASNKIAYGETRCYCSGDTLDSVMNYPLREAILDFLTDKTDAQALVRLVKHQAEVYPAPFRYALMNLVGSHDRARVLSILCGKEGKDMPRSEQEVLEVTKEEYELAAERYRKAIDLLCALPGCPTIYYGDEAGMTGCTDPYCRKTFPWGKEDEGLTTYVRDRLTQRQANEVLRLGHCDIAAADADTVVITRYFTDTDALGAPRMESVKEVITVKR